MGKIKKILIAIISSLSLLIYNGCSSSQKPIVKTNYTKGGGTKKPVSNTGKQPVSDNTDNSKGVSSNHSANCKKLGVKATSGDNQKLYAECASWIGAPYKYGGSTKKGTDCSGMTFTIYKAVYGKTLTRTSAGMLSDNCKKISKKELREGDLVFFRTDGKRSSTPNHVGIYLKENKFIHASTSKGVIVSDLNQEYYVENWIAGGRVK